MKKYENPTMEVEVLSIADVITSSSCGSDCASDCLTFSCPTDTGCPLD